MTSLGLGKGEILKRPPRFLIGHHKVRVPWQPDVCGAQRIFVDALYLQLCLCTGRLIVPEGLAAWKEHGV